MIKVGVLLPRSTLYPLAGVDFLQGIKNCLWQKKSAAQIEIVTANIGFGLNESEIYQQAENLILTQNADAVVIYANSKMAGMLAPLFDATQRLLIMTEMGANYPGNKPGSGNVIFHSLNDSLYAYLTGRLAASEGVKNAILATSFYDGGYLHCHAMVNAYVNQGGNMAYNFVSHYQKEEFTLDPLYRFLESYKDADGLLCLFSGEMAVSFYEQFRQAKNNLPACYLSGMMMDEALGRQIGAKTDISVMKGYTGWVSSLPNDNNKMFIDYYRSETKTIPNLFSLQGWETGLLLCGLNDALQDNNITAALTEMKQVVFESPRGWMKIDEQFGCTYGPAYELSVSNGFDLRVIDTIESTDNFLHDMIQQMPDGLVSNWRNTYLCI